MVPPTLMLADPAPAALLTLRSLTVVYANGRSTTVLTIERDAVVLTVPALAGPDPELPLDVLPVAHLRRGQENWWAAMHRAQGNESSADVWQSVVRARAVYITCLQIFA